MLCAVRAREREQKRRPACSLFFIRAPSPHSHFLLAQQPPAKRPRSPPPAPSPPPPALQEDTPAAAAPPAEPQPPPPSPPAKRPAAKKAKQGGGADAPPAPPPLSSSLAAWGAEADTLVAALAAATPLVPWPVAQSVPPRPASRPPTGSEVGPYLVGRGDPLSALAPALCAALGGEGADHDAPPSDAVDDAPLLSIAAVRSSIIDAAVRRAVGEPLRRGEWMERGEG